MKAFGVVKSDADPAIRCLFLGMMLEALLGQDEEEGSNGILSTDLFKHLLTVSFHLHGHSCLSLSQEQNLRVRQKGTEVLNALSDSDDLKKYLNYASAQDPVQKEMGLRIAALVVENEGDPDTIRTSLPIALDILTRMQNLNVSICVDIFKFFLKKFQLVGAATELACRIIASGTFLFDFRLSFCIVPIAQTLNVPQYSLPQ